MVGAFELGAVVSLQDAVTSKLRSITQRWEDYRKSLRMAGEDQAWIESSMKRMRLGAGIAAAGIGMGVLTTKMISARAASEELESNLVSLKLSASEIQVISDSATGLAAHWGIAKEEILKGSYDIKSAVSDLSTEAIPSFMNTVAATAKATKGNFADMSQLFGIAYNQYRAVYKDLSDAELAKLIGNQISLGVKDFRTDGPKMEQAMKSLGNTGAAMGVKISEQFAVLGSLKNQADPGEAGTQYKAFLLSLDSGMKKLGLSAMDAEGKMKTMPEILMAIKNRFGSAKLNPEQMAQLASAFTREGGQLVDTLLPQIDQVTNKMLELGTAEKNLDSSNLEEMAGANMNNLNSQISRIDKGFNALFGDLGKGVTSSSTGILKWVGDLLEAWAAWSKLNPEIASYIGYGIAAVSVIGILGGSFIAITAALNIYKITQYYSTLATLENASASKASAVGQTILRARTIISTVAIKAQAFAMTVLSKAYSFMKFAVLNIIPAVWGFTAALLANPITWIVIGVVALGAALIALYYNWETVKEATVSAFNKLSSMFDSMPGWAKVLAVVFLPFITIPFMIVKNFGSIKSTVVGFFTSVTDFFPKLIENAKSSGIGFVKAFLAGIKSAGSDLITGVGQLFSGIGKFLPHSDADEGPLSKLTASGKALPATFAKGIQSNSDSVQPVMQSFTDKVAPKAPSSFGFGESKSGNSFSSNGKSHVSINLQSLIGELILPGGDSSTGSIEDLAARMAEAIYGVLDNDLESYA